MTAASTSAYNLSRRLAPAVPAICPLCSRPFPRTGLHGVHCSQACARLAKQRQARAA